MKKIVIFGATGYIGAYLTDFCKKWFNMSEFEIIAVGRRKTNFFDNLGITYYSVDICNPKDFDILPTDNIHTIINLTGLLPAYLSSFNPFSYVNTNITGSVRIMEYAKKSHATRVIYTQTWAEQAGYWGVKEVLSPELPRKLVYSGDHAFYTITKSMIADTMRFYKEEYGIKDFVIRLPNVYMYAPKISYFVDGKEKFIAYRYMIERACNGLNIEMWGNPNAFKDILYVKDVCQMICRCVTSDVDGGIYNAGTGKRTTLLQQIEGYIRFFSPSPANDMIIKKKDNPSFVSFVMDISKAEKELGYKPVYTFEKYLKDYKLERELKRFDNLWEGKHHE